MNHPLVSILCLTYNQEKFIRQALDSFFAQQCDFEYEIVIHDDASSDSTPDIIKEYQQKYPEKIVPLFSTRNKYRSHGLLYIYHYAIQFCKGKYIAYCEGDDFFIDNYKLQKQVDFLTQNPDYNLIHTGYKKYSDEQNKMLPYDSTKEDKPSGDIYAELLILNTVIAPTTMFVKKIAQTSLAELTENTRTNQWKTADYPIWLYLALHGKIGYSPEVTTAYRIHKNSLSSNAQAQSYVQFEESVYDIKSYFIEKFPPKTEVQSIIDAQFGFEMYRYALIKQYKPRERYRAMFRKYNHLQKKRWFLRLCSIFPILENFYFLKQLHYALQKKKRQ